MNKKIIFLGVGLIVLFFGAILFVGTKSGGNGKIDLSNQKQSLLICNSGQEEKISLLQREHDVVRDMGKKSPTIIGFYTTRQNRNLKETYRDLEQATKYGWGDFYDFIEGYAPPTPISGVEERFSDGDLIKMELDVKEYWTDDGALRVVKADKLPFPTRDEIIAQAELVFNKYEEDIFKCADATKAGFPSFRDGVQTSYVKWDRENNTALVTYYGDKEVRDSRGEGQVIEVGIVLDQAGKIINMYVFSRFVIFM